MLSRSDAEVLSKALAASHLSDDLDCGNAFRIAYEAGVSSAIFQISMRLAQLSDGEVDGAAFYKALTEDGWLAPVVTVIQDQNPATSITDVLDAQRIGEKGSDTAGE